MIFRPFSVEDRVIFDRWLNQPELTSSGKNHRLFQMADPGNEYFRQEQLHPFLVLLNEEPSGYIEARHQYDIEEHCMKIFYFSGSSELEIQAARVIRDFCSLTFADPDIQRITGNPDTPSLLQAYLSAGFDIGNDPSGIIASLTRQAFFSKL